MSRTFRSVPHYATTKANRKAGSWYRGAKGGRERWSTYERYRRGLVGAIRDSWERLEETKQKAKERNEGKAQALHALRVANAVLLGSKT